MGSGWHLQGATPDDTTPLYLISVVADLTGLHPQTLRQYDRVGLVSPGRAPGRGRRYSELDLSKLRRVVELTSEGVNLEGARRILELEDEVARLRSVVAAADPRGTAESRRGGNGPNLPVLATRGSTALVLWRRRPRRVG